MRIRPAQKSDATAIEALFTEFVTDLRAIGDETEYRFGAQKYLQDGFGTDPAFRGLVAEDESAIVGYLLFAKCYDGEYVRYFSIVDVYVQRAFRGKGIGRMLMNATREIAHKEGITRLSWFVHKNNVEAIRFYETLGAQISGDVHNMYWDI